VPYPPLRKRDLVCKTIVRRHLGANHLKIYIYYGGVRQYIYFLSFQTCLCSCRHGMWYSSSTASHTPQSFNARGVWLTRLEIISPLVKDACNLAILPWANFIKQILDSTGLSYIWSNPAIVDPQQICTELAERLTDQYKQNWQS
jgi:hypothetical protein